MKQVKLQKWLQETGLGSRRMIRQAINQGDVEVNSITISNPNYPINPEKDIIYYKKKVVHAIPQRKSYYIFNKPTQVMSTLLDPQKRKTILDYIPKIPERVFPVGRLDYHSEGLILLTNDGDLANYILSAKNRVSKTYLIKIKGELKDQTKKKLEKGIFLDGTRLNPFQIRVIKKTSQGNSWIQVTIKEGKKHIIRRAFLFSGHPVEKLRRIAIGTLRLHRLPRGHWRELTFQEVKKLKNISLLQ